MPRGGLSLPLWAYLGKPPLPPKPLHLRPESAAPLELFTGLGECSLTPGPGSVPTSHSRCSGCHRWLSRDHAVFLNVSSQEVKPA